MVIPPAFIAAMPVGASTTILLGLRSFSLRRKVVFPVPALPVRNRCVPVFSMKLQARLSSSFCSICPLFLRPSRVLLQAFCQTAEGLFHFRDFKHIGYAGVVGAAARSLEE